MNQKPFLLLMCLLIYAHVQNVFATKLPSCEQAFGHSSISQSIIFYGAPPIDYCIGEAAREYSLNTGDPKNFSIPKILKEAPANVSRAIFGGKIIESGGKNLLVVSALTVQKNEQGAYQGWLIVRDREKGKELVRRFFNEKFLEHMRIELLMKSDIILFAHIDSDATRESTSPQALNSLMLPYLQFMSATTNLECASESQT